MKGDPGKVSRCWAKSGGEPQLRGPGDDDKTAFSLIPPANNRAGEIP